MSTSTMSLRSSSSSTTPAEHLNTEIETTRTRTAIIIGAGLSGLSCARELEHHGWNVVILESRDRVGGRVWTDCFLNGSVVDIGASFIHGIKDNPIAELALREGIDLHERLTCPLFDFDGSPLNPEVDKYVEDEFNATLERAAKRKKQRHVEKNESLEAALEASIDSSRRFTARDQRAFNWHLSNLEYSVNSDLKVVKNDGWDADDPYGLEGMFSHLFSYSVEKNS
jgi:monoamine oxidase